MWTYALFNYCRRRRNDALHHSPAFSSIMSYRRLGNHVYVVALQGDFVSHLSSGLVDYSRWTSRLVASYMGDNAETDDLFWDDEAMFAAGKILGSSKKKANLLARLWLSESQPC